ncbi:MAG: histidine phosphatase family protein [Actinomycetota bacterium]|nr:histidine phosphatase family protein [Actinomycetota bacterium]
MRKLLLLRHAKSSWDDTSLDDHDRPLAARGRRATVAIAGHLAALGRPPDLVLCSTARRTVETWKRIAPALGPGGAVELDERIYAAGAVQLLRRLREVGDESSRVLLIGHNPAIEDLTLTLVGSGDTRLRRRVAKKYPTGALATMCFDGTWADLRGGAGELTAFVRPKDLERAEGA